MSSRTIYEHFVSLDALLIVAVAEHTDRLSQHYMPPTGEPPAVRVNQLVTELTDTMAANRALAVALFRASLSGKPDVAPYVQGFRGDSRRS